ncbi:MAG: PIN domain-containing protein [Gemmatimonadales bacterium]|nr:MAG: PIN domain-containing protein [Gemmatimonadales bacterium]
MTVDVLFLDANVLFSAAYRTDARVRELWELDDAELVTSAYAIEEAWRNLTRDDQLTDLVKLLKTIRVVPSLPTHVIPAGVRLPDKDRPILLAALACGATYLLTGDLRHFGPLLGTELDGLRVRTPRAYLRNR